MGSNTLLNAALWLARHNMHVFPLRPGTKVPAVRADWEGCATTDINQIHRWWATGRSNVAIATGRSNLVVVDLDVAGEHVGPDGRDTLRAAADKAGGTVPARTMTVSTPSGGEHIYFRAPAGLALTNTAGRIGARVDTRAIGGYVVAPGSVIGRKSYRLTCIDDPAPLPSWLVDLLRPRPMKLTSGPIGAARSRAYVQAAVAGEAARVAEAPVGRRNAVLFLAAARLGRFVAGGELRAGDVHGVLRAAADRHVGTAGFSEAEIFRTIESGLRRASSASARPSAPTAPARGRTL